MKKVLCLVLILMFTVSITAYALPDRPTVGNCSCGGSNTYVSTSAGEWSEPLGQRRCLHGHGGYDFKCYREATDFYECSSCGGGTSVSYREVDWVCGGELQPISTAAIDYSGRAEQCDVCNATMSPYKTSNGGWEGPIQTSQTPNGILYKYQRAIHCFYKCPDCGTLENTTYYEYKWSDINM